MSDPFVGEIRIFAGNFAPRDWALCNGQLLPISDNDTLFTLIGTTYGGDGQSTFALPNLQSRAPIHFGNSYPIGQIGGNETVALATNQLPSHNHSVAVATGAGSANVPVANAILSDMGPSGTTTPAVYGPYDSANTTALSGGSVANSGQSTPHGNVQPYQVLNFIIALYGVFPSRA